MNQNYQHPPMAHHQPMAPSLPGPPGHLPGYQHQQLPPMAPAPYYQNPNGSVARPDMPLQRPMTGPRDPAADMGHAANGSASSSRTSPAEKKKLPPPREVHGADSTRKYQLVVVQHPQRARMCGFGDKDRRPITPPPCIKLVVMDKVTGKEVDCNEIDHQHYILHVDLWDENGEKEVNLVKHTQNQGSISAGSATSYRDMVESQTPGYGYSAIVPSSSRDPTYPPTPQSGYPPHGVPYQSDPYGPQGYSPYHQPPGYSQPVQVPQQYNYPQGGYDVVPSHAQSSRPYPQDVNRGSVSAPANGMFTRNLIGSIACSAARLTDPKEKIGIWFVLQDLSVRTEGHFRLRFSFINLRDENAPSSAGPYDVNALVKGKAKVLAQIFSEPFQVYSAKKFPGVCESTPLSKCFATQGVKIPIRKEAADGLKHSKDDSDGED
jgi:hypothetical protein